MDSLRALFDGHRLGDEETLAAIAAEHDSSGELLDPHSVIGVAAARVKARLPETPMVALAAAHPAKFPEAVERATGRRPALPDRLADLFEREERFEVLPNDLATVQAHIRGRLSLEGAA
jgi:threonine synthase